MKQLFILCIALVLWTCTKKEEAGTPPIVTGFTPMAGVVGQQITIKGRLFEPATDRNTVTVGGVTATVFFADTNRLVFVVPPGTSGGVVEVTTRHASTEAQDLFQVVDKPLRTTHIFIHDPGDRFSTILLAKEEYNVFVKGLMTRSQAVDVLREIYVEYEDKFDFVILLNNDVSVKGDYAGYNWTMQNAANGLGWKLFNDSAKFASAHNLKALIWMATRTSFFHGPSLHEIMHTWGNHMIDSQMTDPKTGAVAAAKPHWGLAGVYGTLGGFDSNLVQQDPAGGVHDYLIGGSFYHHYNNVPYANLELYLMGLIPREEVQPFKVFKGVHTINGGKVNADSLVTYDLTRIEREFGPRSPAYPNTQHNFRALVVVLSQFKLTADEAADVNQQVSDFMLPGPDSDPHTYNFYEGTGGRASIQMDKLGEVRKK